LFKIHHTNTPESVGTTELVNYSRNIGLTSLILRHVRVYAGGMDLAIGAAGSIPYKNGMER